MQQKAVIRGGNGHSSIVSARRHSLKNFHCELTTKLSYIQLTPMVKVKTNNHFDHPNLD